MSVLVRPELIALFETIPAEGPFSHSDIKTKTYKTLDGLFHDRACPASQKMHPEVSGVVVSAGELLERHHEACLTGMIRPPGSAFVGYSSLVKGDTISLEEVIELRNALLSQLEALKTPPSTFTDAFNRLAHPVSFSAFPPLSSERRPQALFTDAFGWMEEYSARYATLVGPTVSALKALPRNDFLSELKQHVSLGYFGDDPPPVDDAWFLAYLDKEDPYFNDELTHAGGLRGYGTPREVMLSLFSPSGQGDLIFAPRAVVDFMRVWPRNRVQVDVKLPSHILEAADVLFDPSSDGPYSTLVGALEAAYAL